MDAVDPNRDGFVSLQDYMAFMISKETSNVSNSVDIENAFRAITHEREFITKAELRANLSPEMATFCYSKMSPYRDPATGDEIEDAYDFMQFTRTLFQNS